MAKQINRLSSLYVQQETKPGMYPDGGGLYMRISSTGAKSFVLRYMHRSKAREMGLGSLSTTSLLQARQKVNECRSLLAAGQDPIDLRNQASLGEEVSENRKFKACAEQYIATHKHSWRHSKHHQQWEGSLKLHVLPTIGDVDIGEINLDMVLRVLEPIWIQKPETAQRVRSRIELIIDWGIARGYRTTDNPARWRGLLQTLLPNPSKIKKVRHFPSLRYEEVPQFIEELQQSDSLAARALEFTILTCVRTNEALSLESRELDLGKSLWVIPAHKTKSGREHRVPLPKRAVQILSEIIHSQNSFCSDARYVFATQSTKPLSNMAMLMLLRRLSKDDITVHGFRSSFRTWAAEQTNYPREVAEAALGHVNGDRVEACYQRSDLMRRFFRRKHIFFHAERFSCLYLALMNHLLGDKFTFAVLDDVLMSVDKGHRREVCKLLRDRFPNTQFIVTTHDEVWLRHMKSEGIIQDKGFVHFRTWSVDTGPKEWTNDTIWEEIDGHLKNNEVPLAAACLRRYLEFFFGEAADRLHGSVEYKENHQFLLGDLLPAAMKAMSDCLKKGKASAQSWGQQAVFDAISKHESEYASARAATQADNWQVNTAVHYNAWADLDKKDFMPVVEAFKAFTEFFSCKSCHEMFSVQIDKGKKVGMRCRCGGTNYNLSSKPGGTTEAAAAA